MTRKANDCTRDPPPLGRATQTARSVSVAYLNMLTDDTDPEELAARLRRLAQISSGSRLAEQVELNTSSLYRTSCRRRNPELKTVAALLKAMGLRLAIVSISPRRRSSNQHSQRRHPMAPDEDAL